MKSTRVAFILVVAALIWSFMKVHSCKAVSLDGGQITSFATICAQNPGLTPSQVLFDIVAEGNVVIYIGAEGRCGPCRMTKAAIDSLCAQYADVIFVYIYADDVQYKSLRTQRTIPELRFYKSGVKLMQSGSMNSSQLQNTLNAYYR